MTDARKTVALLPAHPAQVWIMRPLAQSVEEFASVLWVLRDKDCALPLAEGLGLDHVVLSEASTGLVGNALELTANVGRCLKIGREHGVDLWFTKYGCGHVAARLSGARSIAFNDDDADVVPFVAWTAYPFADMVLVTDVTRMGRFERRCVRYPGYAELFYLHPNRFTPDRSVLSGLGLDADEQYCIVRLSSLQAHHDRGIAGVGAELMERVLELTRDRVRVFISSERPLAPELEPLRFPLPPHVVHHALAFAEFLLCDSQTMASEAAVLGTPAFRINDFVGRISYLDDLENRELAFGYKPGREAELLRALESYLDGTDRKGPFAERRAAMLAEKIDPVPWHAEIVRMVLDGATRGDVARWAMAQLRS